MCTAFLDRPNWSIIAVLMGQLGRSKNAYTYFVPENTTTRGGTSPDGVEMTLIRERKSSYTPSGDVAMPVPEVEIVVRWHDSTCTLRVGSVKILCLQPAHGYA